ncbi:Oxalate-binding protein [bioreactor metagenome]|uniref:Oxalate-binding protein n=1 Tax=bioreactor metagenome TaxID=1076179 RepID=A0A645CW83_9ZZZZ
MIIRKSQIRTDESNLRDGKGLVKREFIVEGDDLRGKAKLFSKITIPVGNSIGMHDHVDDFEVYYILKGKGKVLDNNEFVEVNEGDAIYTADGNKHCIENIGNEDLEFIAIVINE